MLRIEDLHVTIGQRKVLSGINLHIAENETFILFGPNGSGKTTLLMTLMGFGNYDITQGRILFRGHDITRASIHERARLGLGMSFQRPPTIHGLKTRQLVAMCARSEPVDVEELARTVHMDTFLERDINAGFSGGEIDPFQRLELLGYGHEFAVERLRRGVERLRRAIGQGNSSGVAAGGWRGTGGISRVGSRILVIDD